MGFFSKKDKSKGDEKNCFNCGKKLKEGHYTMANNRYCCEKCCSHKDKSKETCEFC